MNMPSAVQALPSPRADTARPSPARLTTAGLACLVAGQLVSQLDFAGVNVSLHAIGTSLGASGAALELVVAVYGVAFAVTLVLGGQLGDAIGRRTVFVIGVAGFLVASLACGVAPTTVTLLLARAAQGIAAALLVPQILATIHVTTSGRESARALSWYGSVGGLSFIIGQVLGGVLLGADIAGLGWRAVFLINVPLCLAILMLSRRIPQSWAPRATRVDAAGTLLLASLLVSLMVPAALGENLGWPWWTWSLLIAVPVEAVALWRTERGREVRGLPALVPPSLLRIHSMRTGLVIAVLFFGCWSGFIFTLTLALQSGAGLSAMRTGLTFVPLGVAFFLGATRSGTFVVRFGAVRTLIVGCLVQMPGLVVTAAAVISGSTGGAWFVTGIVLVGAGQGAIVACIFRLCLADVPSELAGSASAVVSTTQQASLGLGAPLLGSVFLGVSARAGSMADGFGAAVAAELVVMAAVVAVAARAQVTGARASVPAARQPGSPVTG